MTSDRWAKEDFVTAAIATAAGSYQPVDSDLTAIAALATTSYGRAFLALADAAAGRTALGLGTAATHATGDYDAAGAAAAAQAASQPVDSDLTAIAALATTSFGRGLLTLADQAALLSAAGAQAADADLTTIAGLTATTNNFLQSVSSAWASRTPAQALATLSGQSGADFSLNSHKLTAVSDGSAVDDVATFGQVTNLINGRPVKLECRAATTAALATVIYSNGSSGVGATLTGASVGALGAIDGTTLAVADRVLVKNQVAGEQNGAYVVTAVGSGIAVFILTRATDSDQAADLQNGASYYIVLGTTLADTTWALSNDPAVTITVGTTALAFAQVDGPGSTAAGNGLSRSGSTLSIDTAITVDKTTAQTLTNKTLTSPAITTPTGIVKGDVGLGNVDNTSDATKNAASVTLTNKTIDGSQLVAASVTLAKVATQADQTILGNNSGGTAVPSALTASQVRTLLALVIGTNVQAYDADLTTYAGITPGALGQAILPMTTLTNHGLVLGAAGAAPTALAPDSGTTKFLKNSVASDAPTWQTIAESDVTNLTTDLGALSTQTMLQAAKIQAQVDAANGYFVANGLVYSPSATTGKLDRTIGTVVVANVDAAGAAATAIGSTVATLGTALTSGQAMWVAIEIDSAGATQQNSGSAAVAASAVIPATTAGRTVAGWIYIPQGATVVDTALTTNNGNAKFIDGRVVRALSPSGWQYESNSWTFASVVTGSGASRVGEYTATTGADESAYLEAGMRVKLTHSAATKYFIITKVSTTTVTMIGIVNQADLSATAFTNVAVSRVKKPFGFSVKPSDWWVQVLDTADTAQSSPTASTWYNVNSANTISIPIGVWLLELQAAVSALGANPSLSATAEVCASTANNSASDAEMVGRVQNSGASAAVLLCWGQVSRSKTITLAAATSYYMNVMTPTSSAQNVTLRGATQTATLRATTAFL